LNQNASRRRAIITVVSVVLIICLVYSTARDRERLTLAEHAVREVFAPIARGASIAGREISSFMSFISSIGQMKQDNERLKEELDAANAALLELSEAAAENKRLREALAMTESLSGRAVVATVAYRDPGNWLESLVIDKGSNDGISNGQAVVNSRGVVGRITSVTPNTATVLLAVDSRNSIGGLDSRSRDFVIVEGVGDGSGVLVARPLGAEPDLAVGDVMITSGMGGVYPKGHVIGDVIWVDRGKYGVSQLAYVRPRVDFHRLEEVIVLVGDVEGGAK
jgi:rod shape-determining protein MreC